MERKIITIEEQITNHHTLRVSTSLTQEELAKRVERVCAIRGLNLEDVAIMLRSDDILIEEIGEDEGNGTLEVQEIDDYEEIEEEGEDQGDGQE